MSQIRKLPEVESRVETGPVQFGDDWPGVFIRGDDAAYGALCLNAALNGQDCTKVGLRRLRDILRSSLVGAGVWTLTSKGKKVAAVDAIIEPGPGAKEPG